MNRPETDGDAADARKTGIEQVSEVKEVNSAVDEKEDPSPVAKTLSTGRILLILGSIWIGLFFAALDSTIVATLAGPISSSFASSTLLSWLGSGFLIASTAIQPLSGKLTDIFGRRIGLILSNIFFGAGTVLCGVAQREWVIILGRVITGIGAGGLNAISTFVASDLVPTRQRGVYQGLGSICYGLGSGLGGLFGGYMNDHWGWRSAFHFQLPFIFLSTILIAITLRTPAHIKTSQKSRLRRIDFPGALILVTALVLLLLALNLAGNLVPWTHPLVLTTLPLSIVLLCLFVYAEDRVAEPIIPIKLLLNRTAFSTFLANWFLTMSAYGVLYYVPVYFQIRGLSPTQSGVRLIPNSIGAALGSSSAGFIILWRGRYYYLNMALETTLIVAYILIAVYFDYNMPTWPPFLILFMSGFGYGAMLTITFVALTSSADQSQQAVITSVSYLARSTGSVIGVTITSAIFQNVLKSELSAKFGNTTDAEKIIRMLCDSVGVDKINTIPTSWLKGALESYIDALRGVWLCILVTGVLGAVSSLAMKEYKLYTTLDRTK